MQCLTQSRYRASAAAEPAIAYIPTYQRVNTIAGRFTGRRAMHLRMHIPMHRNRE